MPVPALTADGFLPPGIYEATLDEVGRVFGRFQSSDRRVTLFSRLQLYISDLQSWGNASAVLIDGSFASAAIRPNDIDMIVIYEAGFDFAAERAPEGTMSLIGGEFDGGTDWTWFPWLPVRRRRVNGSNSSGETHERGRR